MEGFKKIVKMATGGAVKAKAMCYGGKMKKGGEVDAADIKQDKAIVKKAFKMHDEQEHKGEHTDLSKLKKGGRAKKATGSVRKYKTGGKVENQYAAKKTDKDIQDIANTKRQKPAKLCMGKSVKKYQAGRLVENVMGTPAQNMEARKNEARYLAAKELEAAAGKPMSAGERMAIGLARLGQRLQPAPMPQVTPSAQTVPMPQVGPSAQTVPMPSRKRGGKVCK